MLQGRSRGRNIHFGLLLIHVMNLIRCLLGVIHPRVPIFILDYICLNFASSWFLSLVVMLSRGAFTRGDIC